MTTPSEDDFRRALTIHTAKHGSKETFLLLKRVAGTTAASKVPPEKWATVINAIKADARKHQPTDTQFTKIRKSARQFRKAFGQRARRDRAEHVR